MIAEYRPLLDLIPDDLEPVTLREGGTPLVHSDWLTEVSDADVWLKVEGDNPTGSFKDRGMTAAISVACHEGAQAVVCASTGNTSASMSAYAAKAGITPIVLIPEGKIAAGKMAQAIVHGALIVMVRGNFDHCLQLARELSWRYPVTLVNSVNPVRLQGQKTAAFEVVDFLGDAPRRPPAAGRQRRQHRGVLDGLRAVRRPRARHAQAADARVPGRGRRSARDRASPSPTPRPRPRRSGSATPPRGSWPRPRRTSPADGSGPSATHRSWPRRPELARRDGVFVEPASAAGVAGLLADLEAGDSYAGLTVVITVTGHGLKDTATALESAGELVDAVIDPDVEQAAAAAGLR